MSASLVSNNVWSQLTKTARACRQSSLVAVAYFGQGASRLLPLAPGSILVVDASEASIRAGQTAPSELKLLAKKGVKIYSRPGLHAKVYVLGDKLFIGSANASNNSSENLIEAMYMTSDREAIREAKSFINTLCVSPVGPEELDQLCSIYSPQARKGSSSKAPIRIERLCLINYTPTEEEACEKGKKIAERIWKRRPGYTIDQFPLRQMLQKLEIGTTVVGILEKKGKQIFVEPPGKVIHIEPFGKNRGFLFLEKPTNQRSRRIELVAKRVGRWLTMKEMSSYWLSGQKAVDLLLELKGHNPLVPPTSARKDLKGK